MGAPHKRLLPVYSLVRWVSHIKGPYMSSKMCTPYKGPLYNFISKMGTPHKGPLYSEIPMVACSRIPSFQIPVLSSEIQV